MSTPADGLDQVLPKRMRLGTRSCAECRRRKIRCVFPEQGSTCEGCSLHGVPCNPQQPKRSEKRRLEQTENNDLRKRLDEMETMIRRIYGAVDVNGDSSPSSQGQPRTPGHAIHLGQEHQEDANAISVAAHPHDYSSPTGLDASDNSIHSDALCEFGNTPLVTLFKEALLLQKGTEKPATGAKSQCQRSIQNLISGVLLRLPSKAVLIQILEYTRQFWGAWPPSFHGSQRLQDMTVAEMSDFLLVAFESHDASIAAKALLWIAHGLFSLPMSWKQLYPELAQQETLIDTLMRHSRNLFTAQSEHGENIDFIEAVCLEIKLNVDLGRPRKAWLGSRQAVNASLLLGLHRMKSEEQSRERNLWRMILHWERQTGLVIGIPSSISTSNKTFLPASDGVLPHETLIREMIIVSGAVADRNQAPVEETYPKTIEIDQDWESCKKLMPDDFWAPAPLPGLSFEQLYYRQSIKIQFFMLGKSIHLPYLLKSSEERRFLLSRTACLEASREIIIAYQNLRAATGPEAAPCGLMDFESFSAAMVIVIHLLQEAARGNAYSGQNIDDQNLLVELLGDLRQVSTLKECTVAGQAAEVLAKLVSVLRGEVSQDTLDMQSQGCDVTIPFFGRVRVKIPDSMRSVPNTSSLTPDSSTMTLPVVQFDPTVFDNDAFASFDMDVELTADWTTNFEAADFNWITVFPENQKNP